MIDSMTVWLNEASRYPLLSKTEIIELARLRDKFEPGSKKYIKVVNTICKHNLKLVHRTVSSTWPLVPRSSSTRL